MRQLNLSPYQDGEETLYGVLKIVLEDEDNCPDYIDDEAENLCDWINGKIIEHKDELIAKH